MVFTGGHGTTIKSSQRKKVSNSRDSGVDQSDVDGDDNKDKDESDEDSEVAASGSENDETSSEVDSSDDDDGDGDNEDDNPKNTSAATAAETALRSPTESRKRRLRELEDFVKSESGSNVKGILRRSASSDASRTKLVKFAADKKTDTDSDSRPIYREDIYGRLRDEHGNVVNPDDVGVIGGHGGTYVPPGKRRKLAEESGPGSIDKSADESKQRVEKLTRQVKGQINRLDFVWLFTLQFFCVLISSCLIEQVVCSDL